MSKKKNKQSSAKPQSVNKSPAFNENDIARDNLGNDLTFADKQDK